MEFVEFLKKPKKFK